MTTEVAPKPERASSRSLSRLTLVHRGTNEPIRKSVEGETFWNLEQGRIVLGRDPGDEGITLDDSRASRRHAMLMFERGGLVVEDLGSKNGTRVNGAPIQKAPVRPGDCLRVGNSIFVYAKTTVPVGITLGDFSFDTSPMRAIAEAAADLAAPTKLPILIIGPTGAGKELLAQRIHKSSGRRGDMVALNCATFSKELLGSELFGHKEGAFSGAKSARPGLFLSADKGTLFLDEIAELPLDQQPALLRALQEERIRPVGSDKEVPVDVRIIAATHKPLDGMVESEAFRSDLFARLSGFLIELGALRERKEEILPLFRLFLGGDREITADAAEALVCYGWPQNVRELKHVAERTKLFAPGDDQIDLPVLPDQIQEEPDRDESGKEEDEPASREDLLALLSKHDGNVAQVARALGKHRQQVYRWLKRFNLEPSDYRSED